MRRQNSSRFSDLAMMIQGNQIRAIEHKLRVILSQRSELDNGKVLHVVRVYFSVTEKAFVVRITDPVSGAGNTVERAGVDGRWGVGGGG